MPPLNHSSLSRRQLLKLGMGASLLLGGAGIAATLGSCSPNQPASSFAVLRDADLEVLRALVPVIVGDHPAMSPDTVNSTLQQLDNSLLYSSPQVHKDLHDLLGMLSLGLLRGPLTGIWGSWNNASAQQVETFLQGWRDSRVQLLRQGYVALSQLLLMAWYAQPMSWAETGYPGPPQL